ncbi:MAG: MarR family transcriptional regulator [Clostridia bacterium]|nr:MarR family transcriptional regulator [Clostridia bacterium]
MNKEKLLRLIQSQHLIPKVRSMLEERDLRKTPYRFDSNEMCFLRRISRSEGMTQVELANEVLVPPPTVTRKLNRLIECGIVERRDDSSDYRKKRLYLTETGKEVARMVNELNAAHTAILFEGFTEEERDLYANFLERIRHNAEKNLRETP